MKPFIAQLLLTCSMMVFEAQAAQVEISIDRPVDLMVGCDLTTPEKSRGRTDIVVSIAGLEAGVAYDLKLEGYNQGARYISPRRTREPSFLYKDAWPGRYEIRVSNNRDNKIVATRSLEIRAPEPRLVASESVRENMPFEVTVANAVGPNQRGWLYLTVVPEHYPLQETGQTRNSIKPACDVVQHKFKGLPVGKYELRLFQSGAGDDSLLAKKSILIGKAEDSEQHLEARREQLLQQLEQAKRHLLELQAQLAQQQTTKGVVTTVLGTGAYSDNCVLYARSHVPSLPTGLFNWEDKKKIANANTPTVGSVAMIEIKSGKFIDVGHVAIVESVTKNSITLIEANFKAGLITRRTASGVDLADAASQLNIYGYYQP